MLLNTDYVLPAELTGYVRAALADLPQNQFRLADWLPNRDIDDLQYRFVRGGEGLAEAATYRTYDAESPIGRRQGVTRVTGELPPISRKIRLGEYDRLRQRGADGQITSRILDDSRTMTRAVATRLEMARGEALYTGKIVLAENGIQATVDFGRKAGHTVAPGTLWSNTATATPLVNLQTWMDVYIASNGVAPGAILTSRRVLGYMMANAELRALVATTVGTPSLVSQAAIEAVLQAYGLPPIYIYDVQVSVNGAATRVIPDDRLIMLPAPGGDDDSELGATLFGTTAESLDSRYGIEDGEEPGIVAGAYSTEDPIAIWTKAAAVALPILANPDLTLVADVA